METVIHIRVGEQTLLSIIPGMATHKIDDDVKFDIAPQQVHYFELDGARVAV